MRCVLRPLALTPCVIVRCPPCLSPPPCWPRWRLGWYPGLRVVRGFLGALRGLLWGQAGFGFRQRLFDQAHDEVPLGKLYADPSRFSDQMGLDALEEFLGDLESSIVCSVDLPVKAVHSVLREQHGAKINDARKRCGKASGRCPSSGGIQPADNCYSVTSPGVFSTQSIRFWHSIRVMAMLNRAQRSSFSFS